jgi:hypothetical protein
MNILEKTESQDYTFTTLEAGQVPQVEVIYPNGGEVLKGEVLIKWETSHDEKLIDNQK